MSAPWLLDLTPDALHLDLTVEDLMADLDPQWAAEADADDEEVSA